MKKIFLIFLLFGISSIAQAQWEPDIRLTNDSSSSQISNSRGQSIAVSGDFVHVVWYDTRNIYRDIYYKRSTDKGITWTDDIRLAYGTQDSQDPVIAVSGNNVFISWNDTRHGNYEVYFKKSTDNGTTWGVDTCLTLDSFLSFNPCIAVSGSDLHLVWLDNRNNLSSNIYYKKSTDFGETWSSDFVLSEDNTNSYNVSMSVFESNVHVVWSERVGFFDVFYCRSTDAGNTWNKAANLSDNPTSSWTPAIAANGSHLHLVWSDKIDKGSLGDFELYYIQSADNGESWSNPVRLTNADEVKEYASLALNKSILHLVWHDYRSGKGEIYYKCTTNNGEAWSDDYLLTNNMGTTSYQPSIALSDSIVHVIWTDERDGPNGEIYYKRNPTGNILNIEYENQVDNLFISPNPASDYIYLNVDDTQQGTIQVFSILGEKVLEINIANKIDVSKLPDGIYYMAIISGNKIEKTNFVIMR